MKRRNVDTGKQPRRPVKRTPKFADSVYGSSIVYIKFVIMWMLILLADFILEFRFEYIWPFWLLIQSVYDTFKYQGLAYSVFFVCIAITSDTVCLLFIPIQWLFFMASTYVWMHYVWHTEKGFCPPTFLLWLLFMYVEATIRLRDVRSGPFHIELCRPFAAHCIGHPVVTLGIGLKSYVLYRLRLRTQATVQKENNFYYELIRRALPKELHHNHTMAVADRERNDASGGGNQPNGVIAHQPGNRKNSEKVQKQLAIQDVTMQLAEVSSSSSSSPTTTTSWSSKSASAPANASTSSTPSSQRKFNSSATAATATGNSPGSSSSKHSQDFASSLHNALSASPQDGDGRRRNNNTASSNKKATANDSSPSQGSGGKSTTAKSSSGNGSPRTKPAPTPPRSRSLSSEPQKRRNTVSSTSPPSVTPATLPAKVSSKNSLFTEPRSSLTNGHAVREQVPESAIELISTPSEIEKLETTISRLQNELQVARKSELSIKSAVESLANQEKAAKYDLVQMRKENEVLQTKLQNLFTSKEKDKINIQSMEKRLKSEADIRSNAERLLKEEKRRRKEEEENARCAAAAIAESSRNDKEAADLLKQMNKDLEEEIARIQKKLKESEDECASLKKEVTELQSSKSQKDSETLMSALEAMQDKNLMLENSLSSETRLKLDLFSALGEVKRQLELANYALGKRDAEVRDLKGRLTELLSLLPEPHMRAATPHYSNSFLERQPMVQITPSQEYPNAIVAMTNQSQPVPGPAMVQPGAMTMNQLGHLTPVHLDPNAAMYTPSSSGV